MSFNSLLAGNLFFLYISMPGLKRKKLLDVDKQKILREKHIMIQFNALIKKFDSQGEKTGWTYIEIPAAIGQKLMPGNKRSFRVKGRLDHFHFENIALLPMGDGGFIMALNAAIRKKIQKSKGASVKVILEMDLSPAILDPDLMECLAGEPGALSFFNELTPGHRKYFGNWISSAKTDPTRIKRIALALDALSRKMNYGEMIRALMAKNKMA